MSLTQQHSIPVVSDDPSDELTLHAMTPRIVSLLPSATEVVAAAGGEDWLVGRSHECDFPKGVESLPVLTSATNEFQSSAQMNDAVAMSLERGDGLYALESNLLQELRPDVIVTQDLCAVRPAFTN